MSINRLFVMATLVFVLALALSACGQLVEDERGTGLLFRTADPRLNIGFRLLPAPPVPPIEPVVLPTITPTPEPCLIKGNINSQGEKIAHSPGGTNYEQTVIDESKGEKWFCTMEEAIAEGWRPAQR